MRRNRERRFSPLLAVAFGLWLVVGVIAFRTTSSFLRWGEASNRGREVLATLAVLLSVATDAETASRGYAISGDESFLEPAEQTRSRVTESLQRLRRLSADDPARLAGLADLESLIESRLRACETNIVLRRDRGFEAVRQSVVTKHGKEMHDRIRRAVTSMEREERAALERYTREASAAGVLAQASLFAGGLLACVLVTVAWFRAQRNAKARLEAEAETRRLLDDLERRVAERTAELDRSVAQLRMAMDAGHVGTWEWDLATNRNEWSDESWHLFGVERDSRPPSYDLWLASVRPEDRPALVAELERAVGEGRELNLEWRVNGSATPTRWLMSRGRPLRDEAGRVTRYLGVVIDISERKRIELEATRWQRVFESAGFGLAYADAKDNTFLDVNEAFARERGYTRKELEGRRVLEVYPPEWQERMKETFARIDETGHLVYETVHRRKDGTCFPVVMEVTVVKDARGRPVSRVAYALDISERKRAEDEVRQRNEELVRFIYAVSHDLKSPLVTIRTFLGYLEADLQSGDADRVSSDLGFIRRASDKMAELLEELLELSRVGRKANPPEDVPLETLVREAVDLVAGSLAERRVDLVVDAAAYAVRGDRRRLVEVFQNLLDNATKFMGDQPSPRIEIGVEETGSEPVVYVRDNGSGIDPRHREKLFGLFEKLHPGTPGTGIGLALVKRIVEVHGGRIRADSEGPGRGATFRFTLAGLRRT